MKEVELFFIRARMCRQRCDLARRHLARIKHGRRQHLSILELQPLCAREADETVIGRPFDVLRRRARGSTRGVWPVGADDFGRSKRADRSQVGRGNEQLQRPTGGAA